MRTPRSWAAPHETPTDQPVENSGFLELQAAPEQAKRKRIKRPVSTGRSKASQHLLDAGELRKVAGVGPVPSEGRSADLCVHSLHTLQDLQAPRGVKARRLNYLGMVLGMPSHCRTGG